MKTARRSCFFIENCQKQRFACKRRAKNDENSLSLVFFHQKPPETAFRLQVMSEKREKSCFGASRKVEIQKNNVSGCPDELFFCEKEPSGSPEASKFRKTSFRGVPKLEKSEKQLLGVPRNMKTIKNHPSSADETRKTRLLQGALIDFNP